MKKSFLMTIPVLALLMGSAHAALDLDNLPNLSAEKRAWFTRVQAFDENDRSSAYETAMLQEFNPEIINRILDDAQSFKNEGLKGSLYQKYIWRNDADLETIKTLVDEAHGFESEWGKQLVYSAYMTYINTLNHAARDPNFMERMIDEARGYDNYWFKADAYDLYIRNKDADPDTINRLLIEVQNFENEQIRARIYQTYMESANADPARVVALLDETFRDQIFKRRLRLAYIKSAYADPAKVAALLDEAQGFRNKSLQAPIYEAYLKNPLIHDAETLARIRAEMATFADGREILAKIEQERQEKQKRPVNIKPAKTKRK